MAFSFNNRQIHSDIVEVAVVDHCNLSCRSCSHLAPVGNRRSVGAQTLAYDLEVLGRVYHAGRIRLLGGEPLLHPSLADVARAARESHIADSVVLVTNGVLLDRAPAELWRFVDRIEMSVYPGTEIDSAAIATFRRTVGLLGVEFVARRFGSFRESYSALGTDDLALVGKVYATCQIAHRWGCHNVRDGYFYKCPQAHAIPARAGLHGLRSDKDGISLDDPTDLLRRLMSYLTDPMPLGACRYCLGSVGKRFSHENLARPEWRAQQARGSEHLLDWNYLHTLEHVDPDADNGCAEEILV